MKGFLGPGRFGGGVGGGKRGGEGIQDAVGRTVWKFGLCTI